jgi:NAD-dependent dihydropyrimidine dehydrogenase PreA subunit
MIYVDTESCTGCGACVSVCPQEALSLDETTAVVDARLCTSCGICSDTCPVGAIGTLEVIPSYPAPALAESQTSPSSRVRAPVSVSPGDTVDTTAGTPGGPVSPVSILDVVGKVFNGLFAVATYLLDRRSEGVPGAGVGVARRGRSSGVRHDARPRRGGGGRSHTGSNRRGPGRGQGLGGGGLGRACEGMGGRSRVTRRATTRRSRVK